MNADPTESRSMNQRLSTAEAAGALDMSPGYVRRLARNGTLPGERSETDGRETWTFDRAIVEQLALSRRGGVGRGPARSELDRSDAGWTTDLLLAENADLQNQLLAERLRHAEGRVSALEADNAALRSEVGRWKSLVHSLSAPQSDRP